MFKYCLVWDKSNSSGFTPINSSFTSSNNLATIFCPFDSNSIFSLSDNIFAILVRNGVIVVLKTPNGLDMGSLLITGGLMS